MSQLYEIDKNGVFFVQLDVINVWNSTLRKPTFMLKNTSDDK
jgi:hypothetical protein